MEEQILAIAKKVTAEAEVYTVISEETPVGFEANRLKRVENKQSTVIALRIIKDGRIGYATTTYAGNPQNLVDMAVETAQFGMPAKFTFPGPAKFPEVDVFDSKTGAVPVEKMTALGEEMISRLREHTPELLCEGGVNKAVFTTKIINSRGAEVSFKQSYFSLGMEGTLINGTDMLFVGESESSCRPILNTKTITDTVIEQLEYAKNQAPVATKIVPVIFTPHGVASALVSPLISAFNGKTVLQGASPLRDKIGQTVFDKNFSLWDDPMIPYRPASRPCDDEGVPSQRLPLIENGVVKNFYYDLQTAAQANKKSTGNGQRGRGSMPSPSPSAFVLAAGKTAFKDMLADIKEGLVVEQLMGAEQGNILGGDFSGNVLLGFKVENGKITGRVKNTMVSGNVYQLLKQIAAFGSDARWVGGFLNTPSLYFASVSVASKQ